jgi:hypothetical protein
MDTLPSPGSSSGGTKPASPNRPPASPPTRARSRAWIWVLLLVGVAGLVALLWPRAKRTPPPTDAAPPPQVVRPVLQAEPRAFFGEPTSKPHVGDVPASAPAGKERTRWWTPGQPHYYGDPGGFIRQPLDYGGNTPRILGNRISYHLYDLETVVDMVRRGRDAHSEIAKVVGRPLTEDEWQAGRKVLQSFFDDTTPHVDNIIAGDENVDDGYGFVGPRRRRLNAELRQALNLTDEQFYKVWPHVKPVEERHHELRE